MAQLSPELQRYIPRYVQIESGGDPNARSGKYTGILQMGPDAIKKYGGNSLEHGTALLADTAADFERRHGRQPTGGELYMAHQQGLAGVSAHMANPNGAAWQNVAKYYPSEAVARQAIWGNLPEEAKAQFGNNVNNVSSGAFLDYWNNKVERTGGAPQPPPTAVAGYDTPQQTPASEQPPQAKQQNPIVDAMNSALSPLGLQYTGGGGRGTPPDLSTPAPRVAMPQPQQMPDLMQALGPRQIDVSQLMKQRPMLGVGRRA